MTRTEEPRVAQVAFATTDIAGSLRLYVEGLGFANSGSSALWGDMMELHGLTTEARTIMWWLVGSGAFFQIELFAHGNPRPRALPEDWQAADQGWGRVAVAVSDLDSVLERLPRCGIGEPITASEGGGRRRVAFRDPYAGCFIELIEDVGRALRGPGDFDVDPAIVSVTASVLNLEATCELYERIFGLERVESDVLHGPEDEELWGLKDADRDLVAFRAGSTIIEIVRYKHPSARPKPADHRSSDQGIMNVCLGWRDWNAMRDVVDQLEAAGYTITLPVEHPPIGVTYVTDHDSLIELLALPAELDEVTGFAPVMPLLATAIPTVGGDA